MRVDLFDFELPEELIAQEPPAARGDSRLLAVPHSGELRHLRFARLPALLQAGDLVVLNDTRVEPRRLRARRSTGGQVEVLLLETPAAEDPITWRALIRSSRRLPAGEVLRLPETGALRILEHGQGGEALVRLEEIEEDVTRFLERAGEVPLPPYIRRVPGDRRTASDRRRYQTVFARHPGAVAAPTAGLHFTREVLADLEAAGIGVAMLTLHVGPGTFRPVKVDRVEDHVLDTEAFELGAETAAAIARTRKSGGRIIACGTTVVRVLESRATVPGEVEPGSGRCSLFIRPGHAFRVVDGILTNFHLPRSTLLMLVSAFAGRERILSAYQEAIRQGYRFYSYGDAMFLMPREAI